jgi:hypothetical protein
LSGASFCCGAELDAFGAAQQRIASGQLSYKLIMKFLDLSPLARFVGLCIDARDLSSRRHTQPYLASVGPLCRINSFLDHVDVGEYVVYGDLEAYSCKRDSSAEPALPCSPGQV